MELTQTYTRIAHDTRHCQCHRCERINRSAVRRALRDYGWWTALLVSVLLLTPGLIRWIAESFPGFTR